MMAVADRARWIAEKRACLAALVAAQQERALTAAELAELVDLQGWWRRHRHSRRYCLPPLIEAARRRLAAAERGVAEKRTIERYEALDKARARLARYRAEAVEIARG